MRYGQDKTWYHNDMSDKHEKKVIKYEIIEKFISCSNDLYITLPFAQKKMSIT